MAITQLLPELAADLGALECALRHIYFEPFECSSNWFC